MLLSSRCGRLLAVLAVSLLAASGYAETPILRFGVMTDTHLTTDPASQERLKAALKLFKAQGLETVVHLGDVCEYHMPEAYRSYRKALEETFAGKLPHHFVVYANHDNRTKAWTVKKDWVASFQANLKPDNGPYAEYELNGVPFVIVPQDVDMARYEAMLKRAEAKHQGKPVFVLDHIPAFNRDVQVKSTSPRQQLLERHPNVIQLCGHLHGSVRDPRNIRQEGFTAVNAGGLRTWTGLLPGTINARRQLYDVMVVELFPDKCVFRRYCVLDGKEFQPDHPWCIPLPFDPATAPYRVAELRKNEKTPEFPADAQLQVVPQPEKRKLLLTFPAAAPAADVFTYGATVEEEQPDRSWKIMTFAQGYGNFDAVKPVKQDAVTLKLESALFIPGRNYRFTVRPQGFFGKTGSLLTAERQIALADCGKPPKVLWKTQQPLQGGYFKRLGKRVSVDGAGFAPFKSPTLYVFPPEVWKKLPDGDYQLVLEIESRFPADQCAFIVMLHPAPSKHNGTGKIMLPFGTPGTLRYTMQFKKRRADYMLMFSGGGDAGSVRIASLRLEKF